MTPFSQEGDEFTALLAEEERGVVAQLMSQVTVLLDEDASDSAISRLLPEASADPDEAEEMRRYALEDVRAAKAANLDFAREILARPSIRLGAGDAMRFAGALTDVRLVLADRLDITSDDDWLAVEALAAESEGERVFWARAYLVLGMLTDSLMMSLLDSVEKKG